MKPSELEAVTERFISYCQELLQTYQKQVWQKKEFPVSLRPNLQGLHIAIKKDGLTPLAVKFHPSIPEHVVHELAILIRNSQIERYQNHIAHYESDTNTICVSPTIPTLGQNMVRRILAHEAAEQLLYMRTHKIKKRTDFTEIELEEVAEILSRLEVGHLIDDASLTVEFDGQLRSIWVGTYYITNYAAAFDSDVVESFAEIFPNLFEIVTDSIRTFCAGNVTKYSVLLSKGRMPLLEDFSHPELAKAFNHVAQLMSWKDILEILALCDLIQIQQAFKQKNRIDVLQELVVATHWDETVLAQSNQQMQFHPNTAYLYK